MGLLNGTNHQTYYNGNNFGNYQFISLNDVIDNFAATFVGEGKILENALRGDISFHAHRALAELSFDTFKSCKAQEITVPASLQMILPQDYVNYVKLVWSDSAGIEHIIYPTSKTSNPFTPQADSDGDFLFDTNGSLIESGELITNGNFHGNSANWTLNRSLNITQGTNVAETPVVSTSSATLGAPDRGYFHGWNGNAIGGYDLPRFWSMYQSVPIKSGEEYTLTYTLSGYTSGIWRWYVIDENGDYTLTAEATANGTYTETVTAGTSGATASNPPSIILFTNASPGGAANGNVVLDNVSLVRVGDENSSSTWGNYSSTTPSENNNDNYEDDTYWPVDGSRFGLDPQHAQANGSYYIDCNSGKIHFSSNLSGKTVSLKYISDSLGTDGEMQVHKFAEEAIYKWIAYGCLISRMGIPEYVIARFKKEKFAETRKAKLRLSNIKLEEITQIFRGKSKQIKH